MTEGGFGVYCHRTTGHYVDEPTRNVYTAAVGTRIYAVSEDFSYYCNDRMDRALV